MCQEVVVLEILARVGTRKRYDYGRRHKSRLLIVSIPNNASQTDRQRSTSVSTHCEDMQRSNLPQQRGVLLAGTRCIRGCPSHISRRGSNGIDHWLQKPECGWDRCPSQRTLDIDSILPSSRDSAVWRPDSAFQYPEPRGLPRLWIRWAHTCASVPFACLPCLLGSASLWLQLLHWQLLTSRVGCYDLQLWSLLRMLIQVSSECRNAAHSPMRSFATLWHVGCSASDLPWAWR